MAGARYRLGWVDALVRLRLRVRVGLVSIALYAEVSTIIHALPFLPLDRCLSGLLCVMMACHVSGRLAPVTSMTGPVGDEHLTMKEMNKLKIECGVQVERGGIASHHHPSPSL